MSNITLRKIEKMIYVIRKEKVMLDSDLAELYGVEIKSLNRQVKRNKSRFPKDFMFQITKEERDNLKEQSLDFEKLIAGRKYLPYVFTEVGIAMLSSVLNSERAIQVNISIMRTFIKLRKFLAQDESLAGKIEKLEKGTLEFRKGIDKVFRVVFERLDVVEDSLDELKRNIPVLPTKRRKIGLKK